MDKIIVRQTSLSEIFSGNSSAVFHVNCNYFTQVEISGITVDGAQAVDSEAFGKFERCNTVSIPEDTVEWSRLIEYSKDPNREESYVMMKNSVIKNSKSHFGSSTLKVEQSILKLSGVEF